MGDHHKSNYSPSISDFYSHTKVFITGATGFVGKALVEKLLRSCQKLDAIFVLIRPKRGVAVEQRLNDLLKNSVFNKLREKTPDVFEKIKLISGDVGQPNLGLSDGDRQFLIENINIVFHSAATVKFNENLKTAVDLNTLGTKRVLNLCRKMKKLKSCIHVSTAFSNSDKRVVEERVYTPTYDAHAVLNIVQNLPEDIVEALSPRLIGKHPNTYTFTKALAEQLVQENSGNIPTAIVRPSIITPAWKEPSPGWVDNFSGITGIMMECGRGTIRSIIADENCQMDLVPVDIVVNTLITAAWHVVTHKSGDLQVYNCTSGSLNPVTWKEFGEYTHKQSHKYPSKYVTWYPGFTYTTRRFLHCIYATLCHNIPSALLDLSLVCVGKKPMMLKFSRKVNQALEAGSFFAVHEWVFSSASYRSLIQAVHTMEDSERFPVDFSLGSGFEWEDYVGVFLKGVRIYVLKDEMTSLPRARTKLNRLYWFQKVLQFIPYVIALILTRQMMKSLQ
ncbi:putative fatty acyl-CoA reductase CG5065 [Euwallacea fornicatus]|uniref:putative fatty acyl-CoA reductase CG5065 n=1 Tax=Euwallacea fornicatus TaxID=995702 RepID=UPI00338F5CEB